MKILYLDWNSLASEHIVSAFKKKGYELVPFDFCAYKDDKINEEGTSKLVHMLLASNYDYCFSFNFFPVAALACKVCNVKYVSWTFDSPYVFLYSEAVTYPTNYAFVFDSNEYFNLKSLGIETVYYLPLAASSSYFAGKLPSDSRYKCDISMVGSMYSEPKHRLFERFDRISDFSRGYLEGLLSAQHAIYGADILESRLIDSVTDEMKKDAPMLLPKDEYQTPEWVYSKYFLARELTRRERFEYINALSKSHRVTLFTHKGCNELSSVIIKGPVDYYKEMPYVFYNSSINLNISLRSIVTGIPLRCFDIMGCGGFLLTNYQQDFNDYFIAGTDYVYFDSCDDLLNKADYYLSHEKERREIARNGLEKTQKTSIYEIRIEEIAKIIG